MLFTRLIAGTEWKTKNTPMLFTGKMCYCSVHDGESENKGSLIRWKKWTEKLFYLPHSTGRIPCFLRRRRKKSTSYEEFREKVEILAGEKQNTAEKAQVSLSVD